MRKTNGTLSDLTLALNEAIAELSAPIDPADGTLVSATTQLNLLLDWTGSGLDDADGTLVSAVAQYNSLVDWIGGSVVWGHDTGVTQTNVRNFAGNWHGSGYISGTGDSEAIELDASGWMESEVVKTGVKRIALDQNVYAAGDDVTMKYRTGTTSAECEAASWDVYVGTFWSKGYVQIRLDQSNLWYVDNAATGANDGTSWADAWESFADIAWHLVAPGDTVYISGGNVSKTYSERLKPEAGGTAGNFLTIDIGANSPSPSGHDGIVIIDGGGTLGEGILMESQASYLRINGLDISGNYKFVVQNMAPRPWRDLPETNNNACIRCYNGSYLYIDGMKVYNSVCFGITFDNITNGRMRNCYAGTGDVTNQYMLNGLYTQNGFNNIIENCISIMNAHQVDPLYGEALQLQNETDVTVRNCYLEWVEDAGNWNSAVIYTESLNGDTYIYNNVMLGNNTQAHQVIQFSTYTSPGSIYILNNTIVSRMASEGDIIHFQGIGDELIGAIKNNILISPAGYLLNFDSSGPTTTSKINNNCLRTGGSYVVNTPETPPYDLTWTQWRAAGFDADSINSDPDVDTGDEYRLNSTSPCRDIGADLSAYFTTDRDGSARPIGSGWDIGAHEYYAESWEMLPQYLIVDPGTLYEGFENVADWTASGGAVADDAVNFKSGTHSVKLTTNSGAAATMTKTVNWDLSGDWHSLGFWFYLHNTTLTDYGGDVVIRLSSDSGFTNYFSASYLSGILRTGISGWNYLVIPKGLFTTQGSPDWADPIVRIRFGVTASDGIQAAVSFDDLMIGIEHAPAIIFCFDDGYASQYTASQYMVSFNMRGCIADNTIITQISPAEYVGLEEDGWAICNHTNSSTNLATLSEAEQEANISGGKSDMIADGLSTSVNYLILPSGGFNADTRTACGATGMLLARNTYGWDTNTPYTILPHPDLLNTFSVGLSSTSLEDAEALVDGAITNGMVATFHWHEFGAVGNWSLATFYSFVDYVRTKALAADIYVITYHDYYRLTLGPVSVPPVI